MPNIQSEKNKLNVNNSVQYLTFFINNEQFGIHPDTIKEVVNTREITKVPLIAAFIRGIINLRGTVIPVIDLCYLIFGKQTEITANTQLIIFEKEYSETAIILAAAIDSTNEVINILDENIQPAPEIGSKIKPDLVTSVILLNNKMIPILNINKILNIDNLIDMNTFKIDNKKIYTTQFKDENKNNKNNTNKKNKTALPANFNTYVTFLIRDIKYGIPIEEVDEVIKNINLISIPGVMPYMKGILNLRGKAIPIIDMRTRCGFEDIFCSNETIIIIVIVKGIYIGIIVDSVTDVIDIPDQNLQDTVHYTTEMERDFIKCIGQVKNGLLIILDIEKILTNQELEIIAENKSEWIKKGD